MQSRAGPGHHGRGSEDGDRERGADAKTRQVLFGLSIPSESTQSCICREIDSPSDFMRDSSMLPKAMLSFSRFIESRVVTQQRGGKGRKKRGRHETRRGLHKRHGE